jgi:hypothetical protein
MADMQITWGENTFNLRDEACVDLQELAAMGNMSMEEAGTLACSLFDKVRPAILKGEDLYLGDPEQSTERQIIIPKIDDTSAEKRFTAALALFKTVYPPVLQGEELYLVDSEQNSETPILFSESKRPDFNPDNAPSKYTH